MKKSILILLLIIASISLTVFLGVSLAYGFIIPILWVVLISSSKKEVLKLAFEHVIKCKSVFAIILLLGANISIWMASGILPTIIFHGFDLVEGLNLLLITFVSTLVVSTVMGTGLGTFSTIGIVFIGLATPLNYPKAVIIGCIVSGAFISDKISPVAALSNLTLQMTGVSYKAYMKEALKTLIPTILITGFIYYLLDFRYQTNMVMDTLQNQTLIADHFQISLWLLVMPFIMMVMSFKGINTLLSMLSVFILGSLTSLFYQDLTISTLINYVVKGHVLNTDSDFINTIFKGGGLLPMVEVLIIVAMAVFLTGLLMSNNLLDPLLKRLFHNTTTPFSLVFKTGIMSMFLTSLTCDQTVGITVPGEILHEEYKDQGLSNSILARTISDTGTIIAPLEFWNVNALIITGLTGVSALNYAPYAFLCYLAPIITFIYAKLILDKR